MPHPRMYGNTANLYSYFRPTPDRDRILLGSRSFDRKTPSDRSVLYLKRRLVEIFPDLADCKIDYLWLGNVGFTRAQLPVIFQKEGIYYAAGYAGSGTVWARWMGKKVAELALGTAIGRVFFIPKHLQRCRFTMESLGFCLSCIGTLLPRIDGSSGNRALFEKP